jgi:hypothetical protein
MAAHFLLFNDTETVQVFYQTGDEHSTDATESKCRNVRPIIAALPTARRGRTAPKIERRMVRLSPFCSKTYDLGLGPKPDCTRQPGDLVNRVGASSENVEICVVHGEKKEERDRVGEIFGGFEVR